MSENKNKEATNPAEDQPEEIEGNAQEEDTERKTEAPYKQISLLLPEKLAAACENMMVFDAETGKTIHGIVECDIRLRATGAAVARIKRYREPDPGKRHPYIQDGGAKFIEEEVVIDSISRK